MQPCLWRWRIADVPSPRLVINIEFLPANETRNPLRWVSRRGAHAHAPNSTLSTSTGSVCSVHRFCFSLDLSTYPPIHRETEPSLVQPTLFGRSNAWRANNKRGVQTRRVSIRWDRLVEKLHTDEMIATGTAAFFFSGGGRRRRVRRRGRKVGGWRKRLKGGWRCGWKTRGLLDGRGDQ